MSLTRITSVGTGVAGSPFYTNLYFAGVATQTTYNAVVQWWTDLAPQIATGLSTQVLADLTVYDEADASTIQVVGVTPSAAIPSTGTGDVMALATQGLVRLFTGGLVHNRAVRGKVFIPRPREALNTVGQPTAAYRNDVDAATNTLVGAVTGTNPLVVWSRPFEGTEKNPERLGTYHLVTGVSTWAQWSVLRSRRD